MTDLKFCKDCKWCRQNIMERIFTLGFSDGFSEAKCVKPYITKDLVTGLDHMRSSNIKCNIQRCDFNFADSCGSTAKYFEDKENDY